MNEYIISPQRRAVNTTSKSRSISQKHCSSTSVGQNNSSKCFRRSTEICSGRDEMSKNKTRVCLLEATHTTPSLNHSNNPSHSLYNNILQRAGESPLHFECLQRVSFPHRPHQLAESCTHQHDTECICLTAPCKYHYEICGRK